MADDARRKLQERFARVGEKALSRLHEIYPHLQGKTIEETVTILKIEERLQKRGSHPYSPSHNRREA